MFSQISVLVKFYSLQFKAHYGIFNSLDWFSQLNHKASNYYSVYSPLKVFK